MPRRDGLTISHGWRYCCLQCIIETSIDFKKADSSFLYSDATVCSGFKTINDHVGRGPPPLFDVRPFSEAGTHSTTNIETARFSMARIAIDIKLALIATMASNVISTIHSSLLQVKYAQLPISFRGISCLVNSSNRSLPWTLLSLQVQSSSLASSRGPRRRF